MRQAKLLRLVKQHEGCEPGLCSCLSRTRHRHWYWKLVCTSGGCGYRQLHFSPVGRWGERSAPVFNEAANCWQWLRPRTLESPCSDNAVCLKLGVEVATHCQLQWRGAQMEVALPSSSDFLAGKGIDSGFIYALMFYMQLHYVNSPGSSFQLRSLQNGC